jgi:hypothetical protein
MPNHDGGRTSGPAPFTDEWVHQHFVDCAEELILLLNGVDTKKKNARNLSGRYEKGRFLGSALIALAAFGTTISVALSKTSGVGTDGAFALSILSVVLSALVTLASTITALLGFDKGIVWNERIRAEMGALQTRMQIALLRAVQIAEEDRKPPSVSVEQRDQWQKEIAGATQELVNSYIGHVAGKKAIY